MPLIANIVHHRTSQSSTLESDSYARDIGSFAFPFPLVELSKILSHCALTAISPCRLQVRCRSSTSQFLSLYPHITRILYPQSVFKFIPSNGNLDLTTTGRPFPPIAHSAEVPPSHSTQSNAMDSPSRRSKARSGTRHAATWNLDPSSSPPAHTSTLPGHTQLLQTP